MPNDAVTVPASLRRSTALIENDPHAERDPNDISTLEGEDDVQGLSRVLTEIGVEDDQAKVIIYRLNPSNVRAPAAWLDEISPGQFSIKWLSDLYGGGLFNIRVYVPQVDKEGNKLNRVKVAANKRIYLEGTPKTKKYFEDPGALTAPGAGGSEIAVIVQAVMKSNENILAAIQANQAKPVDPFDQFEKLLKLKMLFAGDQPKASGMDQFREMLGMMKEIEETRAASEGGDSSMMMLLAKKFMDRFDILDSLPAAVPSAQLEAPVAPSPIAERPAPAPAAPLEVPAGGVLVNDPRSEDEIMFEKSLLKFYLGELVKRAKAKHDALEVAKEVVAQADTRVIGFLEAEGWFEELRKLNVEVALYQAFFTTLRDEVLRLAKEGLPPEVSGS